MSEICVISDILFDIFAFLCIFASKSNTNYYNPKWKS